MLYYEGLSCPVCHKSLEQQDDVVVCPQCGLPHHRACWLIENQCFEHDKHGTDQQWSREKATIAAQKGFTTPNEQPKNARVCTHCFTKNVQFAEYCAHCGRPMQTFEWHSGDKAENQYSPLSFSATPSYETVNGISENDLTAFVGANAKYYIPRFRKIKVNQSGGWNWAAFLFGPLWLLYRKQYVLGGFMFAIQTVLDLAVMMLTASANAATTEAELLLAMEQMQQNPLMLPAMCLSFILMIAHILLGVKGTALYLHHCTKKIQAVRRETPDLSAAELCSFGGVSVGTAVLFYVLSSLIANGFSVFFLM